MNASALLATLRSHGATVNLVGGRVRVSAPHASADAELRDQIVRLKSELIEELRAEQTRVEVILEIQGVEFAITADGRTETCLPAMTHGELQMLVDAAACARLTAEMVRAIAAAKSVFPESTVESAAGVEPRAEVACAKAG